MKFLIYGLYVSKLSNYLNNLESSFVAGFEVILFSVFVLDPVIYWENILLCYMWVIQKSVT